MAYDALLTAFRQIRHLTSGLNPYPYIIRNPDFRRERALLARSERYSRDQLDTLKLNRLKSICQYAYRHCAYYRRLFNEGGINPNLHGFSDLAPFPFLTKEIIQENLAEMVSDEFNPSQLLHATTGGSTGIPMGFYVVPGETYMRTLAYEWRQYHWGHARFFERRAVLRGRVLDGISLREGQHLFLSVFHLTDRTAADYLQTLQAFKPAYIEAYPSAAVFLAEWIHQNNLKIQFPGLKAVFMSSESVTNAQCDLIRQSFGCKVFNKYGNSEQVIMIGQCSHGSHHDFEEYSFTEYLDESGHPVTSGVAELIGTGFVNRATPMIRYRTGDLVELSSETCPCGRVHRLVKNIVGRTQDYLLGLNGERVSVAAINSHSTAFEGVLGIQYYQREPGKAVIRLIPSHPEASFDRILEEAQHRSAGLIEFSLEIVSELDKTNQGKRRYIVRECHE